MSTTTPPRASGRRAWVGALLVAGLGQTLVTPAAADDSDRIAALEQKLDQSLQLIRQLSARVNDLEAQAAHGTPVATVKRSGAGAAAPVAAAAPPPGTLAATQPGVPAATPPDSAQRLERVEQTVAEMAASAGQHAEDLGMPMHGFADVGVGNHNPEFPQYQGADIAELDFFLTPRLGSRTRALFELNFEVGSDGAVGVDLERAQIGYQFSDSATVWLWRVSNPLWGLKNPLHPRPPNADPPPAPRL